MKTFCYLHDVEVKENERVEKTRKNTFYFILKESNIFMCCQNLIGCAQI
jgi:hypothetical protein